MSHQQDVARRNIQHIRKDIVSTEGGLTSVIHAFIHALCLVSTFQRDGFKHSNTGV